LSETTPCILEKKYYFDVCVPVRTDIVIAKSFFLFDSSFELLLVIILREQSDEESQKSEILRGAQNDKHDRNNQQQFLTSAIIIRENDGRTANERVGQSLVRI
jgi:hypothetical protein